MRRNSKFVSNINVRIIDSVDIFFIALLSIDFLLYIDAFRNVVLFFVIHVKNAYSRL